jgi:hypothetical protein
MQMQLPLAILFAVGALYSLARCRKQSLLIYLWLVGGIVAFALIANKDVRYTTPVLPAAALLSFSWLQGRKSNHSASTGIVESKLRVSTVLKVALAAASAVWALVSFFNAQWPAPGFGRAIDTPRWRWMVYARNYYGFDHRPLPDDWSVPEIVRAVSEKGLAGEAIESRLTTGASNGKSLDQPSSRETVSPRAVTTGDQPSLGVVVNLPYLNPSSIALEARLNSKERGGPPLVKVEWIVVESAFDRIDRCDYLLVRTGLEDAEWASAAERRAEALIRAHPDRFSREAAFPIPLKNAEAVLYRLEK